MRLEIKDLRVEIVESDALVIDGLSLSVDHGEVAAIMGPNGSGKSTLSNVIAGHEGYRVTGGEILLDGKSLRDFSVTERALAGIFVAFQYPLAIPGLATMTFLKEVVNAQRKARGASDLKPADLLRQIDSVSAQLGVNRDMLKRPLNVGFSGGEKKRLEMLQMALLEPRLCILDETDSGLDVDALRIVAEGINAMRSPDRSMIVITHYQRLLDYVVPDTVHVMIRGRIAVSGGAELARSLEERGYADYMSEIA